LTSDRQPRLSLRQIAASLAEQGFAIAPGQPYPAMSVRNMLLAA